MVLDVFEEGIKVNGGGVNVLNYLGLFKCLCWVSLS